MEKRCPHCGAALPGEAAFCPHCAQSVNRRAQAKVPVPFPWRKALRVDYAPSVQIETAKAKRKGGGVDSASLAAAKEAAKYPIKDEEYIDPDLPEDRAVEIVRDYTEALRKRRLMAFGGWLKDAARALDADNLEDDGDLVHVSDDDVIRDDVKLLIERFDWHFGAGDYILASREISVPLKDMRKEKTE